MKLKPFVRLLLFLFFAFSFQIRQSQAKPRSIFEPIMEDIATRLPLGLKMRLPASIPTAKDSTLYPFLPNDDSKLVVDLDNLKIEFFTVLVADTPDCLEQKNIQECLVAVVGVAEDPIESEAELNALLAENEEDIAVIKFNQKIEGFYSEDQDLQLIVWRQDKNAHLLMTKTCHRLQENAATPHDHDCISKQQLLKMAKTAANQPIINSYDTSYYSY